jgi:NAD(P)-dependent dehydrogenase (short-subunit alcohol dehydrogenase family)
MDVLIDLDKLFRLDGRSAIVTGAAQGMGEAIARYLAGVGVSVAVADINGEGARAVADAIVAAGGQARSWTIDMASETAIVTLVDQVHDTFGRVDILVNNAGVQNRNYLEDTTGDFWDSVLDVNLRGPAIAIREVVKWMRADGIDGRIVNIASNSAFHATTPSLYAYSTSKAGVAGLTRAAAMEVVKDGIRVNAICPGNTATPGQMTSTGPSFTPEVIARFAPPIGRQGRPDDIAAAVLFAVSDASAYMTGQTIVVDGGWLTC